MGAKSRGDDNDPFAKPGGRSSWSGTAQPPPPGPPLPPGSPGVMAIPPSLPAPIPQGPTPAGAQMYPPPPPTGTWGASSAKNWMGITSLVLGITFCGAGILGAIFGHMGLAASRRGEANNRGVALAGVIVNYSMIGLAIVGLVVGVATSGDGGRSATPTHTSGFATQSAESAPPTLVDSALGHPLDSTLSVSRYWYDLTVGDCVTAFYAAEPDASGKYAFSDPSVVPCSESHYGEVYALAAIGGTGVPNDAVFQVHVEQLCEGPAFADYVGVAAYFESSLYHDVLYPNAAAWEDGGREMVCVVVDATESTVGSLRGSGL